MLMTESEMDTIHVSHSKSIAMLLNIHEDDKHLIPQSIASFEYSYALIKPFTVKLSVQHTILRCLPSPNNESDNKPS